MYQGFMGWHVVIILVVILLLVLIAAAVVVPFVLLTKRSSDAGVDAGVGSALPRPVEQRLRELEDLRARGVVSEHEYAERRAAIIREL
jgi:cytochrome c-type biogenesis protein CcmH/NrfG